MRKIVTLLAMLFTLAVSVQAQTSLVATLSHEGTVTTFYSASGLKDAYAAAVDGDVITLSPGSFTAVDLAKGITIRGAGMEAENNPTIINGDIRIEDSPEATGEHHLTLEGVYLFGNLVNNSSKQTTNPSFIKTRIKYITLGSNVTNAVFADCILDDFYMAAGGEPMTASFTNCIVNKCSTACPTDALFRNCVINVTNNMSYCSFSSCIFIGTEHNYGLDSTCTATHCYYQGTYENFFKYIPYSATNQMVGTDVVIFKEGTCYELSDDLAGTWLGNDGTQVGIYGGLLPFDPVPSNPRISKFIVAPRTTADGKLSVEIEVKSN